MKRWLYWLIATLGVVGVVYAVRQRKPAAGAPPAATGAAREDFLSSSIDAAKAAAERLRGSVGNDPLVANLLHISPDLLGGLTDPAKQAQIKALQKNITDTQGVIDTHNSNWSINHDGGLNRDQFAGYIAAREQEIAGWVAQIRDLA